MRTPDTLLALVDHGIIDEVVRPLMSGKEAQIYLVLSGGEQRVAKIYKESQDRTFQNRADYTEGRRVRNSRDQRAMGNRSRHGRAQNEAAWKSAEVDMIYRLRDAGVRVPTPYHFIDGVLMMELVTDAEGFPAPRLGDLVYTPEEATAVFEQLLAEVVRMLCAGVVHGDLSDFNVLMSASGPVVIDFPQAVDATSNQNARKLLLRDVDNLHRFHAKFAPEKAALPYAQEMWELYQRSALTPDTRLSGRFRAAEKAVKADAVLGLIADAERDERRRRERLGLNMRGVDQAGSARQDGRRPASAPGPERPRVDAPREQQRPRADAPREQQRPRVDAPREQQRPRVDAPREQQRPRVDAPREQQRPNGGGFRPPPTRPEARGAGHDGRAHDGRTPERRSEPARQEFRRPEARPQHAPAPTRPAFDRRDARNPPEAAQARSPLAERSEPYRTADSWQRFARQPERDARGEQAAPRQDARPPARDGGRPSFQNEAPIRQPDRRDDPRRSQGERNAPPRREPSDSSAGDPDFRRGRR